MFYTNPTVKKQQEGCILPPIPQDLIQPLRDAIPKIDQALLNSVPEEAIPLCQQLFSAWLSTNYNNNNNRILNNHHQQQQQQQKNMLPPRAKTSMNIKSISQYSSSSPNRMELNNEHHYQHQSINNIEQKQFKKSQSTSRLSSWFSWSIPNKKKNTTIAPMSSSDYYKKSILNIGGGEGGNISEVTVTGELYHHSTTTTTRKSSKSNIDISHINMVSSPSSLSPSLKSSQKLINQSQRRTFSMMLSKIGIKMGRLKENDHHDNNDNHSYHHQYNHSRPISAPHILSSHTSIKKSSSLSPFSLHHHHKIKQNDQKEKIDNNNNNNNNNNNDIESLNTVDTNKIGQQHPWKVETNLIPPPVPYSTAFDLPQLMNELPPLPSSSLLASSLSSSSSNSSLVSVSSSADSISIQEQILFYRSHFSNNNDNGDDDESDSDNNNDENNRKYEQMNRIDRFVDEIKKRRSSLKSSTSSILISSPTSKKLINNNNNKITTMKMSKTETNLKSEMSVPYIKMGLGRKSIDLDDHIQYHRSISSTSFDLLWQEKFHTQQKPRERIALTLKSISLALYEFIQYNHLHQKFNSDTSYVAHPNLEPGKETQGLFTTIPMTHWRDIFDQLAYVFENGELSAEHAVITMIYIERMLKNSKQDLCEANWRLIVLAGLIVSIKVWDDCAVYNIDFVQIFPELDIMHINLIERRFLEHIGWDISVGCSLFASTYFELREKC